MERRNQADGADVPLQHSLPYHNALSSLPLPEHVQQLHLKHLVCSPLPQYMKSNKVSISPWPQFLTQNMPRQERWEAGRDRSLLKLWSALSMMLSVAATGKSWQEREKTISQSKRIYPLASQEELAVYPGMPNVQKIYLGKGSGKCMFLFYPK